MNKREVNIKVLRQNFIKKHQLNPDYFTQKEHNDLEQLEFGDRQLFYHKISKQSQQNRVVSSTLGSYSHLQSHSLPTCTTFVPKQKLSINDQQQTKMLTLNSKVDLIIKKKIQELPKPSVKRSQKQKKSDCVKNQHKVLPNYAVFIMKPCAVYSLKIEPRPVSSFTKLKKQLLQNSRHIRQRSLSQKNCRKKSVLYLQPWETDQNGY